MKHIKYNRSKCIGCSVCSVNAPNIWVLNNTDGKADLLDSEIKKDYFTRPLWTDEEKVVNEIIKKCPAKIISIY